MNKERADLLAAIAELCHQYPDWRLGQLVANVAGWADAEIWDVEDEQILAAAESHLQQLADRLDHRIEVDIHAGRLDEAGRQADAEFEAGRCKPL